MARFKPVGPKSARRYIDTETGNEVSRRQRDTILDAAGERKRKDAGFINKVRAAVAVFWDAVKAALTAPSNSPTSKKTKTLTSPPPKPKAPTKAELKAARAKVMSDLEYQLKKYKRLGKPKPAPFTETFTNTKQLEKARAIYEKVMGKNHSHRHGTAHQGRRSSTQRKPVGGYTVLN